MLRAWRARKGLREPAAVRAWLFTIVRREHARLYDRKRLSLVDIDTYRDGDEADPTVRRRPTHWRLATRYPGPPTTRIPLVMQQQCLQRRIALTDLPDCVRTRLFRARNRLRKLCGTTPPDTDPPSEATSTTSCDASHTIGGNKPSAWDGL